MAETLITCSVVMFLLSVFIPPLRKTTGMMNVRSVLTGVTLGGYFLMCSPIYNMLVQYTEISDTYPVTFLVIATAAAMIPPVAAFVFLFIKSVSYRKKMLTVVSLLTTVVNLSLLINCVQSHAAYNFILAFLPLHWMLPLLFAYSLTLPPNTKSSRSILLAAYGFFAAACLAALVMLIITAVRSKIFNFALLLLILIVILIPAALIFTTLREMRKHPMVSDK